MLGRGSFFYFTAKHFGPKQDASLPQNWDVDENTMVDFKMFLREKNVPFEESEFATNLDWVKRQLRLEMLTTALGKERSDEVAAVTDPEVVKAMDSLPRAKALLDKSKRMVAQKSK